MNKILYFLVFFLRLIAAPLIFIWPLTAIILSFFLDIIDIEFASRGVLNLKKYEKYDKALDLWWYINVMIFSWIFLSNYKFLLLILFTFRIIGNVIFFMFNDRKTLFLFPNFFENVFYLIYFSLYFNQLNFLLSKNYFLISLFAVSIIKMFQEWWIHIAQISIPEDFFGRKRNWKK